MITGTKSTWRDELGMGIYACRLNSGMTQWHVAKKLGIHDSDISRWESGHSAPSALAMFALSRVLGCSIDEMFSQISIEKDNA